MNTSLKNEPVKFIHFKEFIHEQLLERDFIIEIPQEINLFETYDHKTIRYPVKINYSEIITLNFRLLYSSLPENLALLCSITTKKTSLKYLIKSLSRLKKLSSTVEHSQLILERNFILLFEAIFFGELFDSVWKGDYYYARVFAFKSEKTLFYINLYQRFLLPQVLINCLKIEVEKIETNQNATFKLSFKLNYNLFCKELRKAISKQWT